MPTAEYNKMNKNILQLRNNFLTFSKRTDGRYTRHEKMQCRAFIAFSHAEIESYLENSALKVFFRAKDRWINNSYASKVTLALVSYNIAQDINLPDDINAQAAKKRFRSLVQQCFSKYQNLVNRNNGIKRKNISHLFTPLGVEEFQIEESFMIQLDTFGGRRGELVHSSSNVSLPRIRDPFDDEWNDIKNILNLAINFDNVVKLLR